MHGVQRKACLPRRAPPAPTARCRPRRCSTTSATGPTSSSRWPTASRSRSSTRSRRARGRAVPGRARPPDARAPRPALPARDDARRTCCTCRTSCRHVTRPAFHERGCELVPNNFSEVPRLLRETTRCSLVAAAAAPMDRHGYFSLGTNCDYVGAVHRPRPVLPRGQRADAADVRPQPGARQPGGGVDRGRPPPRRGRAGGAHRRRPAPSPTHVAERVPDGATLQAGIGSIPNALLEQLRDHRDLGDPHRAALRRPDRPDRPRRRHRHPQATAHRQGRGHVRPRHAPRSTTSSTRTRPSRCCRSTT